MYDLYFIKRYIHNSLNFITGSLHPKWTSDGWHGAGDQHDGNHYKNRRPEQAGETRGKVAPASMFNV